ncbi:hypothetical protein C0Q70_06882 [Pomacea canaliculata]|uniref:Uncharacterized protein n=1 Tax=Pomacea canaliculata TaxID=400727 RepID=A0A2T7PDI0_POMCA|nr:hypothetical protein C0Q70_06882 [Pomacea canaliculata]
MKYLSFSLPGTWPVALQTIMTRHKSSFLLCYIVVDAALDVCTRLADNIHPSGYTGRRVAGYIVLSDDTLYVFRLTRKLPLTPEWLRVGSVLNNRVCLSLDVDTTVYDRFDYNVSTAVETCRV